MMSVIVNIFPSALRALKEIGTRHSPNETGGVITGTRQFSNNALEFNILGVLGIADYEEFRGFFAASPTEFTCTDKMGWAMLTLKAVETFGMSYIADWHSHPNSSLKVLSSRDIKHLTQQYVLGQFQPFPPLHVLISWPHSAGFKVSAHIMLGDVIAVLEPRVITN